MPVNTAKLNEMLLPANYGRPVVCFVMGVTCASKSTLIDNLLGIPGVGSVEVGKMMRAKYPASHFQGQANPLHTAGEAWQMLVDQLHVRLKDEGCRLVLVDGQPRDVPQVTGCLNLCRKYDVVHHFILLHCSKEVAEKRILQRFPLLDDADQEESRRLAKERTINDRKSYYDVVVELMTHGVPIDVVNTSAYSQEDNARLAMATLVAIAGKSR